MYQNTSREAFNGNKPNRLTMCVTMIGIYREHGSMSDKEFQAISGWAINQVTARRNDLTGKKDCWGNPIPDVELKGEKKNDKNRTVKFWGLTGQKQQEMF